jgi:predicted CopG family antitoxin
MVTTIQVHRDLLKVLDQLKKEMNLRSYEEVIRLLLEREKRIERSHFSTLPRLKPFKREELDRFD